MNAKRMVCLVALALAVACAPLTAQAIPQTMNYQGQLLEPVSKKPKPDGPYNMEFKIFNGVNTELWNEFHNNVPVNGGLFNITLGAGTPSVPINLPFDEQYDLEVWVGGEQLTPRIKLTSIAYAFQAGQVDGFHAVATSVADHLLALNGNMQFVVDHPGDPSMDTAPITGKNSAGTGFGVLGVNQFGVGVKGISYNIGPAMHAENRSPNSGGGLGAYGSPAIEAECNSRDSQAVRGYNDGTLGAGDAVGVQGLANNPGNEGIGVDGSGDIGVRGISTTAGGTGVSGEGGLNGVHGVTAGVGGGFAVFGQNNANGGGPIGIRGEALAGISGTGVQGESIDYGVHGIAQAPGGSGVYGVNTDASAAGTPSGVMGIAMDVNGRGVIGQGGNRGVDALAFDDKGIGVYGESSNGNAGGTQIGVKGVVSAANGIGVEGVNNVNGGGGVAIGVRGESNDVNGAGVLGSADIGGTGVVAMNVDPSGTSQALRIENGTLVVTSPIFGRQKWSAGMNEAVLLPANVLKPESMIIVTFQGPMPNVGTVYTTYGTPNSFTVSTTVAVVPVDTWFSYMIVNPY